MPILFCSLLDRLYDGKIFLLGLLPGFFDTLENLVLLNALHIYPSPLTMLGVGSFMTFFKFSFVFLTVGLVAAGALRKVSRRT
jgi:hypothetical protein